MKRRGNKSSKVPNVKLRPVQEGVLSRLRQSDSSIWAEDSQLGSDDTNIFDVCPRPFKGVVVCATGVDKPTLFKQAVELGAAATTALTDKVTHLVAGDHGGAKYMCALERKIPILTPSWITDSYQVWLRGDDVDLRESVETHRLPVFSGVVLCPSGINDITVRTEINKLVTQHGGIYLKNLERPVRVTHLLCSGDEETEKMKYAEKFNQRGEANVHLVWEEWFWDSLEFGGRFDEEKYQVRRPRPQPKKSLMFTPPPLSSVPSSAQDENEPDRRKPALDNEESTADEELAMKRLPATTLQVWGSLLGRRGYEVSDGQLIRSPSKARPPPVDVEPSGKLAGNGSLISQFRRSNSFAPARSESSSAGPQPFRRTKTIPAVGLNGRAGGSWMAPAVPEAEKVGESSMAAIPAVTSNIFGGAKFLVLGEAKSPSVRSAIEENGGRVVLDTEDEDMDFVIVRLVSGSKLYREEADESLRTKYRTECWLERCIFEDRICSPEEHVAFVPLGIQTPVPGAERVTLSYSGLDQSEACFITRLLRALGINLAQFFSRKTTHLLCPSGAGVKFDKACEWRIPVVTTDWLAAMASSGSIPPAFQFLVPGSDVAGGHRSENTMDVDIDPKGKGKAVDRGMGKVLVEPTMIDILPVAAEGDDPQSKGSASLGHSNSGSQRSGSSPRAPLQTLPFGRPTGALSVYPKQQDCGSPVSKPSRQKPPPDRVEALAGPSSALTTPTRTSSASVVFLTPNSSHVKAANNSTPTRQLTRAEIERERRQTRIPSSKSPSPMKMLSKGGVKQHQYPQLKRLPTELQQKSPSEASKRALQESIESLLGKRDVEEPVVNARPGKRPRGRPKNTVRPTSEVQFSEISSIPMPVFDDSMSPFDPLDEFSLQERHVVDDTMRVTYEDPCQREERLKLMSLLKGAGKGKAGKGGGGVDGADKGVVVRRSSRIAGF